MAGDGAALGFDPAEFRTTVRATMLMGSPNQALDKATFRWDDVRTYTPQDPAQEPYRWDEVPVTDLSRPDVVVDEVAVEYTAARRLEGTSVGEFVPMRAELTILDVDRAAVTGANYVLLHQTPWAVTAETVVALFGVDVYTLFLERQ